MILVTGANGTIGSHVVPRLLARGERVRALVRDAARAAKLGPDVEIVVGDLTRPETLDRAFARVDRVFLATTGSDLPQQEANAIAAAERAGVGHVVKLSVMMPEGTPRIGSASWHEASERTLRASRLAWTMLRGGNFASNALAFADPTSPLASVFALAGDGGLAHVDPRDIADVAVLALTSGSAHHGRVYDLTGATPLSYREVVRILASITGKPIVLRERPPAEIRAELLAGGFPADLANAFVGAMSAVREGVWDHVSPDVERLLGRPPRAFEEWARDHAHFFA
ncbi:NAD(P)H-binding protein [Sandaracinus amylolyticus]|uniref:NAD(P)H-binding protein n=1 Tax=Sandaracinus amylolyticus TaxID=927083 RepID=UPI001F2984E8|nr:NAD(P)H-binding protein [Sandaracinus amylolyticus]UJR81380.1 Nucleoside-diphosphate sugar epimerase [Sandaracinus amylolyticus]